MSRRIGVVVGALVAGLTALPAAAQTAMPGFELERLAPSGISPNSVALVTGDGLSKGTLKVSLLGHYEHDSLVYFRGGQLAGAIVGSRFTAQLGAAYGVMDWLEVGLQLPVILGQGGDNLTAQGISPVTGTVMGAPLLQANFSFLREANGNPLDLGVSLGVSFPLGSSEGLSRDPGAGLSFVPRLGAGHSFGGLVRVGAEFGAVVRGTQRLSPYSQVLNDEIGSLLQFGLTATTLGDGLRGELNVRGLAPLSTTTGAVEVLVGVRYPLLDKTLEIFVAAGPGIGKMPGSPLFRVLGGVAWTPLAAPRCQEGQPYKLGECPALDVDGDGVRNALDLCPEVKGLAQLEGCPDKDEDGDGVPNLADACPRRSGSPKYQGCPAPDTDGDGIADSEDACPALAGVAGARGCPDVDSDGDGVIDGLDKCPDAKGGADGCPSAAARKDEVKLEAGKISLSDKVYFELNKADIAAQSLSLLTQVAETMKAHPELKLVRIEGHTDNSGPAAFNTQLSQRRADAVKTFLESKGVEASRLESAGYGPARPIASNADPAGREKNRRTEFFTVE